MNAGNGGAGLIIDALEPHLPFEFIKINHEPDGTFPNGVPNPMLEENRAATTDARAPHGADVGLAWDGDYDRCFFFDESGAFIEGYYLVGLLAEVLPEAGARRAHRARPAPHLEHARHRAPPRRHGRCCASPATPSSRQKMREVDAAYGGEMSAHHYFRDFAYCDSGMIPWLLVLRRHRASAASRCRRWWASACGCSRRAARSTASCHGREGDAGARCGRTTRPGARRSISPTACRWSSSSWRFNLRGSNTEPLVRLNVESRADEALMREKTAELLKLIDG